MEREKIIANRKICERVFKEQFGDDFELTWTEKVALQNYFQSFLNTDREINPTPEAVHWFLKDYFDIDLFEMYPHNVPSSPQKMKMRGVQCEESEFLGKPEFKEYVKDRIKMWRDERELI